jgi:hypothetical protein
VERFEEWIRFVFDHPAASALEPAARDWYWDADDEIERWTDQPTLTVQWMTRLFEHPESLAPFSRDQVAQGICLLVGESSPGTFAGELLNADIELDLRLGCVRAIPSFFANYMALKCVKPTLVRSAGTDALEWACFMWWDIWPTWNYRMAQPSTDIIAAALLDAMAAIGALPSTACAESALHGLGHWYSRRSNYSGRALEIIDGLLLHADGWSPELVEYAKAARRGGPDSYGSTNL